MTADHTRTTRYSWKTEETNEKPSHDEFHRTLKSLDDA